MSLSRSDKERHFWSMMNDDDDDGDDDDGDEEAKGYGARRVVGATRRIAKFFFS
jgi:hypothetical protein